jgi:hypothetical protein
MTASLLGCCQFSVVCFLATFSILLLLLLRWSDDGAFASFDADPDLVAAAE